MLVLQVIEWTLTPTLAKGLFPKVTVENIDLTKSGWNWRIIFLPWLTSIPSGQRKCPQDQLGIVCAGALHRNNVATKTWKTTDFYDANKSTSDFITSHSYRIHVDLPFRSIFHIYFSCSYGLNILILSINLYLYVIHIYSSSFLCYDHIDCHFSSLLSIDLYDLSVISICHCIQLSFILICDLFRFNRYINLGLWICEIV